MCGRMCAAFLRYHGPFWLYWLWCVCPHGREGIIHVVGFVWMDLPTREWIYQLATWLRKRQASRPRSPQMSANTYANVHTYESVEWGTRTGWRRLIGSPKLQIIFHKRATKYRALLRKMTYKDKGSYESSPPCSEGKLLSEMKGRGPYTRKVNLRSTKIQFSFFFLKFFQEKGRKLKIQEKWTCAIRKLNLRNTRAKKTYEFSKCTKYRESKLIEEMRGFASGTADVSVRVRQRRIHPQEGPK